MYFSSNIIYASQYPTQLPSRISCGFLVRQPVAENIPAPPNYAFTILSFFLCSVKVSDLITCLIFKELICSKLLFSLERCHSPLPSGVWTLDLHIELILKARHFPWISTRLSGTATQHAARSVWIGLQSGFLWYPSLQSFASIIITNFRGWADKGHDLASDS